MKEQAILYDTTYCTGCNTCTYKCVQEFGEHAMAANGHFRTIVQIKDDGMVKKQCMHCKDPQCVHASSGAFSTSHYGAVLLDTEKLKDPKKAAEACPFHAIQVDHASGKAIACNMCAHRLAAGQKPACVEACPAGAMQSGDYETMAAKAKQIAEQRKLTIYGLKENGGTRMLILTKANPAALGYPNVKKHLLAGLTSDVGTLPLVAGAVYVGLKTYRDRCANVAKTKDDTVKE